MAGEGAYPPGVTGKMIDALEGIRKPCPVWRVCKAAENCDRFDFECPNYDKISDILNDEIPFTDSDYFTEDEEE